MTEIIAEIGWNHMGNMSLAKNMIYLAAHAGADFAKFQTWSTETLTPGPWDNDGRREIYEKAQLSWEQHIELKEHCDLNNIKFLTSVFRAEDLSPLRELTDVIKIPSHEARNYSLISKAIQMYEHVILSVGATTNDELAVINSIYYSTKRPSKLTIMHCVSSYPTPKDKADLARIDDLKAQFNKYVQIGYSGHVMGIWDAIVAITMNAAIVEKHFTSDNTLPGRDNQFAITTEQLHQICEYRDLYPWLTIPRQDLNTSPEENEIRSTYAGRWSHSNSALQK